MKDHKKAVSVIVQKEFGVLPKNIVRMIIGLGNEVYFVSLEDRDVVVRLNKSDKNFCGSDKYIPLYRDKGIKVPEILASDYSKDLTPYCYQILSKIEGKDMGVVIADLGEEDLSKIAKEVVTIFQKLHSVSTNGKFGYVYADEVDLASSWTKYMQKMVGTIKDRNRKSGVIDERLLSALDEAMVTYSEYFESVPSKFYYDDISSKNIMIHNGVFQGLVDLDGAMYGDYLEAIGRIKGSWYGTKNGDFYTVSIIDLLGLDAFQKKIVTFYAFVNRLNWLSETGVKFNENTTTEIDWKVVEENKKVINSILSELRSS